ncbi:MAG TPA: DUF4835 family protein [Flavobacteriaceae bacterium]|nr:DUF4835 family protein [Flavobacteriaceae bacterium]
MKKVLLLGILLLAKTGFSQEINCQIVVSAKQTGQTNLTVFNTLENSLTEFVNETNWTNEKFEEGEKINCSMFINITEYDAGAFSGTIQIQSSRPVYGAAMTTPILNFKDNNFSFQYMEYEALDFNPNSFDSNLVSIVSFYIYTILGLDADTFSPLGGSPYFQEAQRIVVTAQQSGFSGWMPGDGDQSRYQFNEDLLSPSFEIFRNALYAYHREGLDVMHEDVELGKQKIAEAIQQIGEISGTRTNSIVIRSFFDAKSTEIEKIFSGGPSVEITEVVETLNDLAPQYSKNWRNISY